LSEIGASKTKSCDFDRLPANALSILSYGSKQAVVSVSSKIFIDFNAVLVFEVYVHNTPQKGIPVPVTVYITVSIYRIGITCLNLQISSMSYYGNVVLNKMRPNKNILLMRQPL